jgi:hypothetical protein
MLGAKGRCIPLYMNGSTSSMFDFLTSLRFVCLYKKKCVGNFENCVCNGPLHLKSCKSVYYGNFILYESLTKKKFPPTMDRL